MKKTRERDLVANDDEREYCENGWRVARYLTASFEKEHDSELKAGDQHGALAKVPVVDALKPSLAEYETDLFEIVAQELEGVISTLRERLE